MPHDWREMRGCEGLYKVDEGEDEPEDIDLRCVGCEYGSTEDRPIKLSTGRPSFEYSTVNTRDERWK